MRLAALHTLYFSISTAMTRLAERYKVCQVVCFLVTLHAEHSKRCDMVNALTNVTASLAGIVITFQRFTSLCCPVRPAIVIAAIDILRMVQAMPVFISTWARAIFTTSLRCLSQLL